MKIKTNLLLTNNKLFNKIKIKIEDSEIFILGKISKKENKIIINYIKKMKIKKKKITTIFILNKK